MHQVTHTNKRVDQRGEVKEGKQQSKEFLPQWNVSLVSASPL